MKHYLTLFLLFISISFSPAFAAFPVSTTVPAAKHVVTIQAPPSAPDNGQRSGIFGILSLTCSLIPIASPLAIVFGVIGMGKKRKRRGLAEAGLIVGAINVIIIGTILLLIGK